MDGQSDAGTLGEGRSPREPAREQPSAALSARFSGQARTDTKPELVLRSQLHRRGLRFRVQYRVPGLPRRRVDIAFTRLRIAVLVDGCFWHGCPLHCVIPKANREWWLWKFATNRARDEDTNDRLAELGWTVIRVWEHEVPGEGLAKVSAAVREARKSLGPPADPPN